VVQGLGTLIAAGVASQTALGQHCDEIHLNLGFSSHDLSGLKERAVI